MFEAAQNETEANNTCSFSLLSPFTFLQCFPIQPLLHAKTLIYIYTATYAMQFRYKTMMYDEKYCQHRANFICCFFLCVCSIFANLSKRPTMNVIQYGCICVYKRVSVLSAFTLLRYYHNNLIFVGGTHTHGKCACSPVSKLHMREVELKCNHCETDKSHIPLVSTCNIAIYEPTEAQYTTRFIHAQCNGVH